jgi:large subunit ribosomal protein L17
MRHRVAGRKLGRTTAHRQALLRNLSTALFDKESIRTTLAKAKELRPFAERLVTLSKRDSLHARRLILRHVKDRAVVAKLFDTISTRFAQRPGGYTRIIKLGPRRGDNAEMAIIELVESDAMAAEAEAHEDKPKKRKKKAKAKAKAPAKAPAEKKDKKAAKKPATKKKAKAKAAKDDKTKTTKKKTAKKKTASKKTKSAAKKGK